MSLVPSHNSEHINRTQKFQTLSSGAYWRAKVRIPKEGIDENTVLLLQSIRWVDEKPHTIIMRPHPEKIGQRTTYTYPDADGQEKSVQVFYNEHRFLLNDFLDLFEYEPDYARIRAEEMQKIQRRIAATQAELANVALEPQSLLEAIEQHLQADADKSGANDACVQITGENASESSLVAHGGETDAVMQISTGSVASALKAGITKDTVTQMRMMARRESCIAEAKFQWMTSRTEQIARDMRQLTPFFEEQCAASLAKIEDTRVYLGRLHQGIESLDLYTGKEVDVMTVRQGPDAPAHLPLTFVQQKLLMDEELAVFADIDASFDYSSEKLFFDTLKTEDKLVNQIFPTERCVLVMAVTRRYIDYGIPLISNSFNEENHKVFLLVRNGMNVYRIFSPVESHLSAHALFPSKDEQDAIFKGLDGENINFDNIYYTDRLAKHELHALHYKRFLLLCAGLDHRLKLFGHFYDDRDAMSFVSLDFQQRYCHFLFNGDQKNMIGSNAMPPLREWIASKNQALQSGSRVLCHWDELMDDQTAPGACKYDSHSRKGFRQSFFPDNKFDCKVASKKGNDLVVSVNVSGYGYSGDDRNFLCNVYLTKDGKHLSGIYGEELRFLCLDVVEPEELQYYIYNRHFRSNHIFYIRLFKSALHLIEQEREQEAASRSMLLSAMASIESDQREKLLSKSIAEWRSAQRGKAFPAPDQLHSSGALKFCLNRVHQLVYGNDFLTSYFVDFCQQHNMTPLRIQNTGKGAFYAFAAVDAALFDHRFEPHAHVQRFMIKVVKGQFVISDRVWCLLPAEKPSDSIVKKWPESSAWEGMSSSFASPDDKLRIINNIENRLSQVKMFSAPMNNEDFSKQFSLLKEVSKRHGNESPSILIPLGLVSYQKEGVHCLCLYHSAAYAKLAALTHTSDETEDIDDFLISLGYLPKFVKSLKREDVRNEWDLAFAPVSIIDTMDGTENSAYVGDKATQELLQPFNGWPLRMDMPLLDLSFKKYHFTNKNINFWLPAWASDAKGQLAISSVLKQTVDVSYDPVELVHCKCSAEDFPADIPFKEWLLVCPRMINQFHHNYSAASNRYLPSFDRSISVLKSTSIHSRFSASYSHETSRVAPLLNYLKKYDVVRSSDYPDCAMGWEDEGVDCWLLFPLGTATKLGLPVLTKESLAIE